jgi:hypothetical protein
MFFLLLYRILKKAILYLIYGGFPELNKLGTL